MTSPSLLSDFCVPSSEGCSANRQRSRAPLRALCFISVKTGSPGRCRRCFWRFPASCAARMFRTLTSSTCRHLSVGPENAAAAQPAAFRRGNRTPNDVTNRLSSAFCRADDIITDVAGGVGVDVLMLTADHLALGVLVVRKRNGLAHHCGHVFFIDRHPQRREKLRVA